MVSYVCICRSDTVRMNASTTRNSSGQTKRTIGIYLDILYIDFDLALEKLD